MSINESAVSYRRTAKSSNRSFGFIIAIFFAVVAVSPLLHGGHLRVWAIALGVLLVLCAILRPNLLAPFNRVWQRIGLAMHAVVNPIVMGLVFYGAIVPVGIILKLRGKDLLRLKWAPDHKSYWLERAPPGPASASMSKQF